MNLRQLRLARGWSQEQLAELAGLNIRTIQRVERGQNAGLETLKALAAVFETSVHQLQEPPLMSVNVQAMPDPESNQPRPIESSREVEIARFKIKLLRYALVVGMLFAINLLSNPHYIWAWWPAIGWGLAIVIGGVDVFAIEPLKEKAKSNKE